jgi:hypothetical protein
MRIYEFAPSTSGESGGSRILPWPQFAELVARQAGVWRMTTHDMGQDAVQCFKRIEDETGDPDGEYVDLHIIFAAVGDDFHYMIGSTTNGERDSEVDDRQKGILPRTSQSLAEVMHLARELFGF